MKQAASSFPDAARIELWSAVAMTVAAVSFHVLFFLRAGALWRDEINSLNLSSVDSLGELWKNLQYDSFPVGWFAPLRLWTSLVPSESDQSLRLFGVLIGLALIAAVWFAGTKMSGRPPVIAIALLLVNGSVVRYGDSIRGYGLGMVLGVLAYWAIWHSSRKRDNRSLLLAVLAAIASVHVLYYNAVLVFAACIGGTAVATANRSIRDAVRSLGIGAIAALTVLPYASVFEAARSWNDVIRYEINLTWIYWVWEVTLTNSGRHAVFFWNGAAIAAVLIAFTILRRTIRRPSDNSRGIEFHAAALVSGLAAYLAFLATLSYHMSPWYFLALCVLIALPSDALIATQTSGVLRIVVIVLAMVHVALSYQPSIEFVNDRMTNADQVATFVADAATPDDLVIVGPWFCGISFERYYNGAAPWITVPPIEILSWHRYDLFNDAVDDRSGMDRLFEQIDETLAAGHRVFLVRNISGEQPLHRRPPPFIPEMVAPEQMIPRELFEGNLTEKRYEIIDLGFDPPAGEHERLAALEIVATGLPIR